MDRGAWWPAVHGITKSRTWLTNFTFTFHFHALEKEMATHSSVLAWRIPGTGEPGGLPSLGSQSRTRLKWLSSRSSSIHLTCPYVFRSFIFFKLEFSLFCITIDNAIGLISEKSSYWDIYSANICHMCTMCLVVFWVLGLQRWNQQLSCGKELSV